MKIPNFCFSNERGSCGVSLRVLWLVLCSYFPVTMISVASTMLVSFTLFNPNVAMLADQMGHVFDPKIPAYICNILGIFAAVWCSDQKFYGSRWSATVFFQAGLIILLLFFWLSPVHFITIVYRHVLSGINMLVSGATLSLFIAALESVNKKRLGMSVGALVLSMYCIYSVCREVTEWLLRGDNWNAYCATVILIGILGAIALWFCRPLPSSFEHNIDF